MKSLDQFKSLSKSTSGGPPKTFAYSSRPPESTSSGSLANLKLTVEKFMKEQASVKTDLEMANTRLKKSMEHICASEEKLQDAFNKNAKFKVKQKEVEKLRKGLESKFSSTLQQYKFQYSILLTRLVVYIEPHNPNTNPTGSQNFFIFTGGTTASLAANRQNLIGARAPLVLNSLSPCFEGKLSVSAVTLDGLTQQMDDLSINLESAEQTIMNREKELEERRLEKEETYKLYRNEQCRTANLIGGKDAMIKNFEETLATNRLATESLNTKLGEVHLELKLKEDKIRRLMTAQENSETEKHDLHLSNDDLVKRLDMSVLEIKTLKNNQESIMTQLSEESRTARERIQKLESETEALVSKKIEAQKLVSDLELQIDSLSESSRSSENKMQNLLIKISALETENNDNTEKLQAEIQKKAEQIDGLPKEGETHERHVDLMDKQVSQLHSTLEEKEQLVVQYKEREKNLEEQITEAINDIRKRYEVEKLEIVNTEKQKAENLVRDWQIECEKKLEECKEEIRQHLMRVQEEHAALVSNLQQEQNEEERSLKAKHSEELKQIQLQAENESREKVTSMRNEHETQRLQHEDEIKKFQEDLDLQQSKEDKQRALLQLQWKVMSDKPEEQEVNSKKEYSNSLRRNPVVRRRGQRSLRRPEHDEKVAQYSENHFSFFQDPRRQKRRIFSLPLLIALISIITTTTAASPSSPSPPPPLPSSPPPTPLLSINPGIVRKIVCLIIAYAVTVTTVSIASPAMFRMWRDYLTTWVDWFYSTHHCLVAPLVHVFSGLYRCLFVVVVILVAMLLVVPAYS
ncbi:hypothetical protein ACLB2K_053285 [Fragaria x ananassa]